MDGLKTVLVTGGAGYVGSALVPRLLREGYRVKVLDLYIYGSDVFDGAKPNPNLLEIRGDIRDEKLLDQSLSGVDAVIHLACISNDPSYELNPKLGKSINHDAFLPLVRLSKKHGVKRFIYASSSSVYGIKAVDNVTEDLPLEPLTDYSKFKALCEEELLRESSDEMTTVIFRPSTVCGCSPRLRLDLTVNILTNHAINKGEITVFGGGQKRPNIHIQDMVQVYVNALQWKHDQIHRKIFNVGYENFTVREIAEMVREEVDHKIPIKVTATEDNRSYHVSSEKIRRELGFVATHSIRDAIRDLKAAFDGGKIPDSMTAPRYYNIKTMQQIDLN